MVWTESIVNRGFSIVPSTLRVRRVPRCGPLDLPPVTASATLMAMGRRSQFSVVSIALIILAIVVAAIFLRGGMRCEGFAGPGVTSGELPPPVATGELRIATWNLRNFPLDERPQYTDMGYSRQTNICDLEAVISGLDAHVLGFSEITDARRFPPILRRSGGGHRYKIAQSRHGGRSSQRLAIAWDADVLELVGSPMEIREVALTDALRPAFVVTLRRLSDGLEFLVVQLHLKSRREGYATRMEQHRALIGWLVEWTAETGGQNVIVMGDFNTVGSQQSKARQERRQVDAIYADIGLVRLPNITGCSEYWEGGGAADGVQVPSLIDLVYIRGFEDTVPDARSWLHCKRAGCNQLVSREGEEDGTFWDVSDHCPVTFEIP